MLCYVMSSVSLVTNIILLIYCAENNLPSDSSGLKKINVFLTDAGGIQQLT